MNRVEILRMALRLNLYANRAGRHLQSLSRREHIDALADLAETQELARRLYQAVTESLQDATER
jgi:hypothetical protein